uniref:DUF4781 domain-containing protein n=1 Tax=Anopheles coluzzii TaxID=1518534 RepID=A0A6E8WA55_ANOCL
MSTVHIARIMHDFLHRGVERELDNSPPGEEFYQLESPPHAANLLAFALGQLQPGSSGWKTMEDMGRPDLLPDRKLYKQLEQIVLRMPTLEFQLIPLVMQVDGGELQSSFLMRVRKAARSADCVYVDLANRKYDRFAQFIASNTLPACVLWVPQDGRLRYAVQAGAPYPMLTIERHRIERVADTFRNITTVGTVVGSVLSMTPLGPAVGLPLLVLSTAASSGFSLSSLVDGCKHESGKVVTGRAVALAFSLTSFAGAGLTAACRVEKLRRLIPADRLVQLERAEKLLSGGLKKVATGSIASTVVGTVCGWKTLSTSEQIELGALLCFAYRESFSWAVVERLICTMQLDGVVKFFCTTCPNLAYDLVRVKIRGTQAERYLQLVVDVLEKQVSFTVDDNFTTIKLFGYTLQFDTMFSIDWEHLKMVLLFLQSSRSEIGNMCRSVGQPLTQDTLADVVRLLQLVKSLPDIACAVTNCITLGRGHRFSFATVRALMSGAEGLNRTELLKQLAAFDHDRTAALNELRESGCIEGGDQALFRWLGCHQPADYNDALAALEQLAKLGVGSLKFEHTRIVVSALCAFEAKPFLAVPLHLRALLLRDERFLALCNGANPELLPRANRAWIRTVTAGDDTLRQLETIELLKELFACATDTHPPLTLADALDYALGFEDGTVPQVYYRVLALWKQCATVSSPPKATCKARFLRLLEEVHLLHMDRYFAFNPKRGADGPLGDEAELIGEVRKMLPTAEAAGSGTSTLCFGPPERAACWLELIPALRNDWSHSRIYQALSALLTYGTAVVLEQRDKTLEQQQQQYVELAGKKMLMFARGDSRVVIEVLLPAENDNGMHRASFYLCGSAFGGADGRPA